MSPKDVSLQALVAPIAEDLASMREILGGALVSDVPAVSDMLDHIARFRGKQLRGALVLLNASARGRSSAQLVDQGELPVVAAIVELIHLATLVHDDVLDGADKRRRVASVNRRWDNQVAVLLGDLIYARAFHLSTTLRSPLVSQLLSQITQEICAGEIEQAAGRYDFQMTPESYERIATAKTGALYGAACELGSRYPDGSEFDGAEMRSFGREIGLAFQIIDDLIDLEGDEEVAGKSTGTDVEDGKVTLAVLHAYKDADPAVQAAIRDAYTLPELEGVPGGRLKYLLESCDLEPGKAKARARAAELVESGRKRLTRLPEGTARTALYTLSEFVLERRW
ncbi:Heptaprenyl diphosphate synthase component 2 [Planctomycetes bacterium Poly30]|uniref:Heptaprenyl diphosphate synthase component 2 n=1 Tax=Saltatorellus ferox TaxID=2528018 RepID=A0A518ESR7_9BACT|nr:Heptaprenyl diphosphate synthase component 2 [Planctomycetes bacterium Poly30]